MPPLGLSNRALGKAEAATDIPAKLVPKDAVERDSVSSAMTSLPTEEELSTSTLWPEIEKVYGHGYEVSLTFSSLPSLFLLIIARDTRHKPQRRPHSHCLSCQLGRARGRARRLLKDLGRPLHAAGAYPHRN